MVEKALERHQFVIGAPNDSLLAEASAVPDANIQVSAGTFIQEDGVTLDVAPAAAVGPFGVFTGGGADVERWDLVSLDLSAPAFAITTGTDQPAGVFQTSVPPTPQDQIPVAAVKITEAGTVIVVQSDIVDARSFYHPVSEGGEWVRQASEFASLQAAITSFNGSRNNAGTLVVDGGTITLSGTFAMTTRKSLKIVGTGAAPVIELASGVLTLGLTAETLGGLLLESLTLQRTGTNTGQIAIAGAAEVAFKDVTVSDSSSTATVPLMAFTGTGAVNLIVERSTVPPSTNDAIFGMTTAGKAYTVYYKNSVSISTGTGDIFDRAGGAGDLAIHLEDFSELQHAGWGAAPATIDLFMDGTSLGSGTDADFNTELNSVSGHAYYCQAFTATEENAIRFFAGSRIRFSAETHTFDGGGTAITRTNITIEGEAADDGGTIFTSSAALTTATTFISVTGGDANGVNIRDISFSVTAGAGAETAIVISGFTLVERVTIDLAAGTEVQNGISACGKAVDCRLLSSGTAEFDTAIVTTDCHRCEVSDFLSVGLDITHDGGRAVDCLVDMSDGATSCVGIDQDTNSYVSGCTVNKISAVAITTSIAIRVTGGASGVEGDGARCIGNQVNAGNKITDGISSIDDGNVIQGNNVNDCVGTGIITQSGSTGCAVIGNVASDCTVLAINNVSAVCVIIGNVGVNSGGTPQVVVNVSSLGQNLNVGDT